jgi:hypothetical protein
MMLVAARLDGEGAGRQDGVHGANSNHLMHTRPATVYPPSSVYNKGQGLAGTP